MPHDESCDCCNGACEGKHGCGCDCDCQACGEEGRHFGRRFFQTRAEKIEELEGYLAEIKLEVQAVEEQLADLRK